VRFLHNEKLRCKFGGDNLQNAVKCGGYLSYFYLGKLGETRKTSAERKASSRADNKFHFTMKPLHIDSQ